MYNIKCVVVSVHNKQTVFLKTKLILINRNISTFQAANEGKEALGV